MSNELKALPKKVTKEIRGILEGCRDGKLKHNQEYVHCGTAHCIAGWKVVKDAAKFVGKGLFEAEYVDSMRTPDKINGFDMTEFKKQPLYQEVEKEYCSASPDYFYAKAAWRLTEGETHLLFSSNATFDYQFQVLEYLEDGKRFDCSTDFWDEIDEEPKY